MTPSSRDADALLDAIISSAPPPYALIQRNLADGGAGLIDVLVGDSEIADTLADLATEISPPEPGSPGARGAGHRTVPANSRTWI